MRLTAGKYALIIFGSMLGVLFLQSTLLNDLTFWGIRPDLVLILIGSIALNRGWGEGLLWGMVGGLLEDVFSSGLFGSHALAKTIIGFLLGLAEGQVFKENPLLPAVAILLGTFLEEVLFFLAAGAFGQVRWTFLTALRQVIIPTALINSVIAPFVYLYVVRLGEKRALGRRER
ncbi:MAG: rod shape-determining protein MreD [Bacillota bacterium]|jgi:rod shape-determining protein MreD|nr:rod shape-determining protein MreD [Bacillota bacterium]MDK2881804.1 rod shape-determining protein MreD [Bacillota bacterium]MDK2960274.1 rod shape-determining protein MreD [Bacillota bacterium]